MSAWKKFADLIEKPQEGLRNVSLKLAFRGAGGGLFGGGLGALGNKTELVQIQDETALKAAVITGAFAAVAAVGHGLWQDLRSGAGVRANLKQLYKEATELCYTPQSEPGRMAGKAAGKGLFGGSVAAAVIEVGQWLAFNKVDHKHAALVAGIVALGFAAHSLYEDVRHRRNISQDDAPDRHP